MAVITRCSYKWGGHKAGFHCTYVLLYHRAKKVVSDCPGLVDFVIRLVNSVLNFPYGQMDFF